MTQAPQPSFRLTPFQTNVMMTPEDSDLFLGGGRGGGKSFALAALYLRHAEQWAGRARMLYVRRTFPGVVDFEQVTREVFALAYGTAASYNAGTHMWRLPNGATLQLDQIENVTDFAKYQGKSFTLIGVDEAGQYPDPYPLDLLRSSLRAPAPIHPRFILAANPGGPGHGWLVRRHVYRAGPWQTYVEEKTGAAFINCSSVYVDNPHLNQGDYKRQLDAATALDPELGRAWRDGDWSVARGAYFSGVLDEKRVMVEPWAPEAVPRKAIEPAKPSTTSTSMLPTAHDYVRGQLEAIRRSNEAPPLEGWDLYLAHDFGVSAPSVTYVCAESPGIIGPDGRYFPRGSIVLLDELATCEPGSLERGMGYTVPRLADEIVDLAKRWNMKPRGVADDAIFGRTGSSAGTIADEFNNSGVHFKPARKGERVAGWEIMRRMLQAAGSPDQPGLYVSRLCSYWWDTVPVLARDPRRPDDVDSRTADHGADASRYALNRVPPSPPNETKTVFNVQGLY